MKDKPVATQLSFNEALQIIADTPKDTVLNKKQSIVDIEKEKVYNAVNEAVNKPPRPAKRRR